MALARLAKFILAVERPHPVRVAIDGVSAAGKTTLADELAAFIEPAGRPAIRASADDFHRPTAERYARGRLSPEGYYYDAFDYPALRRALLEPLGPGGNRRYRTAVFDAYHEVPLNEPESEAPPNAVLLLDGVFLLRPELNDLWDVRIFVDVPFEETMRRGVARDREWVGSQEAASERYLIRYVPGEQLYLQSVRPRQLADVVAENADPSRPRLLFRDRRS